MSGDQVSLELRLSVPDLCLVGCMSTKLESLGLSLGSGRAVIIGPERLIIRSK